MVGVCVRILANELEPICVHVHVLHTTRRMAYITLLPPSLTGHR